MQYKQALDLFQFQQHNGSTVFNLTSPPLFEHASNNPSRLRGQHQHTGATTTVTRPTTTSRQVDVYRNDKGNKQVGGRSCALSYLIHPSLASTSNKSAL